MIVKIIQIETLIMIEGALLMAFIRTELMFLVVAMLMLTRAIGTMSMEIIAIVVVEIKLLVTRIQIE